MEQPFIFRNPKFLIIELRLVELYEAVKVARCNGKGLPEHIRRDLTYNLELYTTELADFTERFNNWKDMLDLQFVERESEAKDYIRRLFKTREEAETILEGLIGVFDKYGKVTVADLNNLCGLSWTFLDGQHGWTSLKDARVIRAYTGWVLELPFNKVLP